MLLSRFEYENTSETLSEVGTKRCSTKGSVQINPTNLVVWVSRWQRELFL